ncbi:MAG: Y-family DNA polymerase [Desulfovibrio sp.]|nr:Y-family DNA polymerase [Desulfovibrio sp.]
MARFAAPDGSLTALVDCDTFYASCEKAGRPDLRDRPVVVLSNNDGCVVARSREAKRLGVPMGEPEYQLRRMLEDNHVVVFSSNYALYGDLSRRVMRTIASVAPDMEIYSIDEAFVRLSGAAAVNADEIVRTIRTRVARWVGLPVSIGLAPTKVLAKIATSVAKKIPECDGVFDLSVSPGVDHILEKTPVGDVWGVGRKGSAKLRGAGIHTARELRDADTALIRRLLTIVGVNLQMELRGVPAIREEIPMTHTTIISSRSLGRKIRDMEPLLEAVAWHAARAGEKLRLKNLVCGAVGARIQTAYYAEDQPQRDEMIMVRLARPSDDTSVLIRAARNGLRKIYRSGFAYAKVMVMLTDLSDPAKKQHNLLDIGTDAGPRDARRRALMELMDRVNRVRGRGTLTFAAQGLKNADWHMQRARLSPAWTTDINGLLTVRG